MRKSLKKYLEGKNLSHATLIELHNENETEPVVDYVVHNCLNKQCDILRFDGSAIGIEDVRSIKSMSLQKYSESPRVIVIASIDKLSIEAQNSLLKNIEEPTDGLYYIMVTENLARVLTTIQSRSLHLKLPAPNLDDFLDKFHDTPYEEIEVALLLANNNYADALKLLSGDSEPIQEVKELFNMDKLSRLAMVDTLSKDRQKAIAFAHKVHSMLHFLYQREYHKVPLETESLVRYKSGLQAADLSIRSMEANGNIKLALDMLFTSF